MKPNEEKKDEKVVMTTEALKALVKEEREAEKVALKAELDARKKEVEIEKENQKKELAEMVEKNVADELKKINPFGTNFSIAPEEKEIGEGLRFGRYAHMLAKAELTRSNLLDVAKKEYDSSKTFLMKSVVEGIEKTLTASDFTGGGALIPPEFSSDIIPAVYNASVFRKAGATTYPMPSGTLTIPKHTAGITGYWMDEAATDITVSEPSFSTFTLNAKKLAAITPISNDLLRSPAGNAIDRLLRDEMAVALGLAEDAKFLRGAGGAGAPKGVYYSVASGAKANSAGTTQAYIMSDLTKAKERLEGQNLMPLKPVWIMSSRSKNYLESIVTANGVYAFRDEMGRGTLLGYPVYVTNTISNAVTSTYSEVYLVDMARCIIGDRYDFMLEFLPNVTYGSGSNTISGVSRDISAFRAIKQCDFAMTHDRGAAIIEAVGWGA